MALDHQAQVDQLMAEYRRSREQLVSVQRGLAAVTACAASHDELVTVTVGANGTLTGLVIDKDAYRRYRPDELAELIVRTTEVAVAEAVKRMREELAPVLPSGVDPDAVLKGRGDVADAEVEPEPSPTKPAEDDSFENMTWLSDGSQS